LVSAHFNHILIKPSCPSAEEVGVEEEVAVGLGAEAVDVADEVDQEGTGSQWVTETKDLLL